MKSPKDCRQLTNMKPRMNTTNATSAGHRHGDTGGGRLSNISLSGGFGTVTLGQIWSASGLFTTALVLIRQYVGGAVAGIWRCQLSKWKFSFLFVKCWRCELSNR